MHRQHTNSQQVELPTPTRRHTKQACASSTTALNQQHRYTAQHCLCIAQKFRQKTAWNWQVSINWAAVDSLTQGSKVSTIRLAQTLTGPTSQMTENQAAIQCTLRFLGTLMLIDSSFDLYLTSTWQQAFLWLLNLTPISPTVQETASWFHPNSIQANMCS